MFPAKEKYLIHISGMKECGKAPGDKHWDFLKTWHCYGQGLGPEKGNGTWHHLPTELCSVQPLAFGSG